MELLRLAAVLGLAIGALVLAIRYIGSSHLRSRALQVGIGGALGGLGAAAVLALRFDVLPSGVEAVLLPVVIVIGSTLALAWIALRLVDRVRRW